MGELEGVGKSLPNPSILFKPLLDREAIDSSTIEGTYASARELLLFQIHEEEKKDGSFTETREVSNYVRAMERVITQSMPLNVATLREMHRILLTGTRGDDKTPGEIRHRQVAVGKRYRFVPPPRAKCRL